MARLVETRDASTSTSWYDNAYQATYEPGVDKARWVDRQDLQARPRWFFKGPMRKGMGTSLFFLCLIVAAAVPASDATPIFKSEAGFEEWRRNKLAEDKDLLKKTVAHSLDARLHAMVGRHEIATAKDVDKWEDAELVLLGLLSLTVLALAYALARYVAL